MAMQVIIPVVIKGYFQWLIMLKATNKVLNIFCLTGATGIGGRTVPGGMSGFGGLTGY
jgi:hypothetical protein